MLLELPKNNDSCVHNYQKVKIVVNTTLIHNKSNLYVMTSEHDPLLTQQ